MLKRGYGDKNNDLCCGKGMGIKKNDLRCREGREIKKNNDLCCREAKPIGNLSVFNTFLSRILVLTQRGLHSILTNIWVCDRWMKDEQIVL